MCSAQIVLNSTTRIGPFPDQMKYGRRRRCSVNLSVLRSVALGLCSKMASKNAASNETSPAFDHFKDEDKVNWEVAYNVFEARFSHAVARAPELYTSERHGVNYRWAADMQIYHWNEFETYYGEDVQQFWDASYKVMNRDFSWYMSKELAENLHMTKEDLDTLEQKDKMKQRMIAEFKGIRFFSFDIKWRLSLT